MDGPTGLRKELTLRLEAGCVHVQHRLIQVEGESERAPWAITAFAPEGRAWLPRVAPRAHADALVPDQSLILWSYTDLADPRLTLGSDAVVVRQDPTVDAPIKVGAAHPPGWLAWTRGRDVVVQHTRATAGARADLGATQEIYADAKLVELEALGPIQRRVPGEVSVLEQTWWRRSLPRPADAAQLGALVE